MRILIVAAWLLGFISPAIAFPDDERAVKVVPAAEAKGHVGERCTIEMTVRASKNSVRHKEFYLDSESDFRDPKNFAVVIEYRYAESFKCAGIDDPATHFKGKTIRATGLVIREEDQTRIRVEDPEQIQVVKGRL